MTKPTKVPELKDSGSDGSQIQADAACELVPSQPLSYPIVNAITGLAASKSRPFGGEVASTLIAGAASQMAVELNQTKDEFAKLREKNEALTIKLADERVQKAVLVERIDAFRSTRHLKNIGIAVGTLLTGIGVQLVRADSSGYGLASIIVGALLLIVGWLSAPKEGGK